MAYSIHSGSPSKHFRCLCRTNSLQVAEQRLDNSRVELTLTVSAESTRRSYESFIKRCEEKTTVPGFRRGQSVPLPLLMRQLGGQEAFTGQLLLKIIEKSTEKALSKWQGVALADSDRLETDVKTLLKNFNPDNELRFRISFDVLSEVKWRSPYTEIKIDVEDIGDELTDRANVDRYIRTFLKRSGTQRIVQNRGLDFGDVAILDFEFVRPDNREPLPSLKQEKFQFDTDLPDALGIIEKLKGIRPGDVVEAEVVFPENWEPSTFKGLETIAIVNCHELFEWDLPELTDEIVKSLNQPSLQSVDDFRDSLLQAETGRRAERLKDKIQQTLMQELVKIIDMEVSETALMETAKVRYQKMLLEYQAQGKIGPDALKQLTTEAMLHNFMISHKTEIESDQKAAAAMEAIFKDLELSVSPEELEAEVKGAEQEFKEMGEQYDLERLQELAKDVLSQLKVVEWFIKNEKVNIIPYSA
eukprot:g4190.t1